MRGFTGSSGAALLAILAILTVHLSIVTSSPSVGFAGDFFPIEPECRGSIAECSVSAVFGGDGEIFYDDEVEDAAEFEMDSETNRRILAWRRRYISYGALRRNSVPCSRRGASYYNCRRGGRANPYSRGCSRIARCRR